MHVLFIPGEHFDSQNPGNAIFEMHQAKALREQHVQVGFITSKLAGTFIELLKNVRKRPYLLIRVFKRKNIVEKHIVEDFPVVECSGFQYYPSIRTLPYKCYGSFGLTAFEAYVKFYGMPDIVHAHSRFLTSCSMGLAIKHKYGLPLIITEHSSYYFQNKVSVWEYKLVKKIIQSSDEWIVVSKQLGKLIKSKLPAPCRNFIVIPNVLDPNFINTFSFKKIESRFVFLSIGSLYRIKGHKNLIQAFANIFGKNDAYILHIAGAGPLKNYLAEMVTALGLEDQVIFLGHLQRKEIMNAISTCSALVSSSEYETFGVVLIEALSFGKPVIACKSGGPIEIVNHHNGILSDSNSVEDLSRAMGLLVDSYHSYDSKRIHEECLKKYSPEVVANQLIEIYGKALTARERNGFGASAL
jgi:glycosyltransferase involved in cell wall biosynthesis